MHVELTSSTAWQVPIDPLLQQSFDEIIGALRSQPSQLDEDGRDLLQRVFALAVQAHAGQFRASGEPYLTHPLRVALTIVRLGLDVRCVAASILHDTVEDSSTTVFEIEEHFGDEVAGLVDGVTKLGKVPYLSRREQQAESFRKMLLAMSRDIRVLILKLADRLDNMRTLDSMPSDKRERISRETMEIFAPLAGRLGIEWMRTELQNLAFRYLQPALFREIGQRMAQLLAENQDFVERSIQSLRASLTSTLSGETLAEEGRVAWPEPGLADITTRATMRTPHKIHRLMLAQDRSSVDQISDLVTFQLVTRDRLACYAALGQIHAAFKPVPGRFRDYVALPRPNRYQALHTSVIDRSGKRLEIQIRSREMDDIAERGIVVDLQNEGEGESRRLEWLRSLLDWQGDISDPSEFIEAVKADLFADEVYVFSPKGDIYTFRKGATPIDFAFAIHTDVGMQCSGARVNGHVVPLRYQLRQGDTIEILANPKVRPRREWINMCTSARARTKIRHCLSQIERTRFENLGRELVGQVLVGRQLSTEFLSRQNDLGPLLHNLGVAVDRGLSGIYEDVGSGRISTHQVNRALSCFDEIASLQGDSSSREDVGILSRMFRKVTGGRPNDGITSAMEGHAKHPIVITHEKIASQGGSIHLPSCCSALPGDPLGSYFSPGLGIVAHVQECPALLNMVTGPRLYLVWKDDLKYDRTILLRVKTLNNVGLLAEMSRAFSQHGVNIRQANCRAYDRAKRAENTFEATFNCAQQLHELIDTLKHIQGVWSVERVFQSDRLEAQGSLGKGVPFGASIGISASANKKRHS